MPFLAQIENNQIIHRFRADKEDISIGRRPDNDILLPSMMVSGHHARLIRSGDRHTLHDLQSTNGTSVNGNRLIGSIDIREFDHIVFGNIELIFVIHDNATIDVDAIRTKPHAELAVAQVNPDDTGFSKRVSTDTLLSIIKNVHQKVTLIPHPDQKWINDKLVELEHSIANLGGQLKEFERSQEKLNTIYEVGKVINLILDSNELLNTIIDLALKVMNADAGFIMLYDENNLLTPTISRSIQSDELQVQTGTFSTTIAKTVAETGASILTSDAEKDERFQGGASIISQHIRSVICSPLKNKDQKVIGVIYVGSNVTSNVFSKDDVELLEAFSNHAAISIENAKLYEERRRKEHLKSALERYVSKQIAEMIMSKDASGDIRFAPEKKDVTILFTDIRGFTPLAEGMSPEELVELLNRYFSRMIQIIFKYGGTLDKFIGDSIMALFGAPASSGDDAFNAVCAAIEMQIEVGQFNAEQKQLGKPEIQIGIGVNSSPVIVGNIGSDQRMEYTAIGDGVNLSSRLQGKAQGHQIIISKSTCDQLAGRIPTKELEAIMVKGKSVPVEVFEVIY